MVICNKKVLGIGRFVIYFWSLYPAVLGLEQGEPGRFSVILAETMDGIPRGVHDPLDDNLSASGSTKPYISIRRIPDNSS
jgi:hypothetical protein